MGEKMEKEEFLKLLPKLIREDDEVKGAIITALSGVVATKDDIARIIEHSDRRFEEMEKRFEASDKRFEAFDKRFEAMLQEMKEGFKKAALERELIIKRLEKGFEEAHLERLRIETKLDTFMRRSGKNLENAIIELLKEQLIKENIPISEIKKVELEDKNGIVFDKGYVSDIDILIMNGKTILIEIKYRFDLYDAYHFKKNAELYKHQYGKDYDELMVLCLEMRKKDHDILKEKRFRIICGNVIEKEED
ncbi:MAG: hypothetical protein ACTSPH_07755 [Promethearchaeota archaeon]